MSLLVFCLSAIVIGETVSHYRIIAEIGAGGMGVVYRAEDTRLNRYVAIKFLPTDVADDFVAQGRFIREAQTASALNHPNICTIHDLGEHRGQPYIVMELLAGKTLRKTINGKPLPLSRFLQLATEIANALVSAHGIGIIHRDIKGSNIFVDEHGHARLLDFGLAKMLEKPFLLADDDSGLHHPTKDFVPSVHTATGSIIGTTNHMSPEQARGEELDQRSDLFSFGVVLFEMATGRVPFRGKTVAVMFDEVLNKVPPPVHELNPQMPAVLSQIIAKALEKDLEKRYQTAAQISADLRQVPGKFQSTHDAPISDAITPAPDTSAILSSAGDTDTATTPSIAVLPFVNLGGVPENDYFGDGLAEELIGSLMKVRGLRVVARTSAFQFKGQSLDVREIGRRLNVSTVLEGSFRMAGNRIRISANFINVADGYQLWSDRFDRDQEDVFAVQDEIATTIVNALEVTLIGKSRQNLVRHQTENVEAYNQYLRGRFHWKKRRPDAIHQAVECFKAALDIDPGYAAAHAGLADCYAMLGTYAIMPRKIVMPQARLAANKALEIDNTLAEPYAALGVVAAIHDFDWASAETHFQRAIELSPDYAIARYWYAIFMLLPVGRFDEALGQAKWAAQLDPVSPTISGATGMIYHMMGQDDRAIDAIEGALELDRDNQLCNIALGWAFVAKEMYDEALATFDRCSTIRIVANGGRAWALALAGRRKEAEELLEELAEASRQGNSQAEFEKARVHIALGQHDQAFDALESTYEQRGGTLFWLNVNPMFDPLRADPRFDSLLQKLNLEQTSDPQS